jgi:hypothetical protein
MSLKNPFTLLGGGFAVRSRWGTRERRGDERDQDEPDPGHRTDPNRIDRASVMGRA